MLSASFSVIVHWDHSILKRDDSKTTMSRNKRRRSTWVPYLQKNVCIRSFKNQSKLFRNIKFDVFREISTLQLLAIILANLGQ